MKREPIDLKQFEGHTPRPWQRGTVYRNNPALRGWSHDAFTAAERKENAEVYCDMSHLDYGKSRRLIATCNVGDCDLSTAAANAALMTAAPDLKDEYIRLTARCGELERTLKTILPKSDLKNIALNTCVCIGCGKKYTASEAVRRNDKCDADGCELAKARAVLSETD